MKSSETTVREIFASALKAADPSVAVAKQAARIRSMKSAGAYSLLHVIGFGKASISMAQAAEEHLGDIIDEGVVITKYGHAGKHGLKKIRVHEAGHPVPDENGVKGAADILDLAGRSDENSLVVVLISGGGSALFVSPVTGLSLRDKQETTSLLLRAGADISELNTVRKHLSKVKGGRLAELLYPATTISLILSDVIGDHLDVIASGPTAPDTSSYRDALITLEKFRLLDIVPQRTTKLIHDGIGGIIPETPKEGNRIFRKVENMIVGSNRLSLKAAKDAAEERGLNVELLSAEISGEAREVGKRLARIAFEAKRRGGNQLPLCIISGGETTVTVTGSGKGGRNMELALAFAMEIDGTDGITLLSAGTDGTDGPTDAAGAIVDGMTVRIAGGKGLNPAEYLADNDSYNFFRETGGLLVTGPTGTNVMDMQIMVIE